MNQRKDQLVWGHRKKISKSYSLLAVLNTEIKTMKKTLSLLGLCAALVAFNTPVVASDVEEEVNEIIEVVNTVTIQEEAAEVKAAGDGNLTIEDGKELIEAGKNVIGALGDGLDKDDLSVVAEAGGTVVGVASDVVKNVGKITGVLGGVTKIFGGGDDETEANDSAVVAVNSDDSNGDA